MNPEYNSQDPDSQVVYTDGQPSSARSSRKKSLLVAGAIVVVLLVIGGAATMLMHKADPEKGDSGKVVAISSTVADVSIGASGYVPQTVTVKQGQQVTFTNNDTNPRQLSADQSSLPGFNTTEPLDQGDSYTYIFDQKGTYHYYDATDPTKFVGTVTVQ